MNIIIKNIGFFYGENEVIKDCCMELKEDHIHVIMGPSGSGKTTLLKIIAGLLVPHIGTIQGLENKRIAMVFQEDRLCEEFTALSNVLMVCGGKKNKEKAIKELAAAGLQGSEYQLAKNLSGGMRRRVALVRALMSEYDILLLDEPFKGLDEENKNSIITYMKNRTRRKIVLMVTHEKIEAELLGATMISL